MRLVLTLSLAALAVLGCSRTTELIDDGSIPGLLAIEVTPGDATVVIEDLTAKADVALVAIGRFESGETRDVTGEVEWGLDKTVQGDFVAPAQWQSSNRAGGLVSVAATAGPVRGQTTIAVHFRPTISDPSFPPPPQSAELFEGATVVVGDADNSPLIVYPSDSTMFPINLHRTLFQFDPRSSSDIRRIRFESEYLDLRVLTTNDRWQAEGATWGYVAHTAADESVVMTVAGVDSVDPSTVWQSDPVTLHFSNAAVGGALYYWSTSAEGIMKATLADSTPIRFYTESPDTTCVACHTVSRDGRRMAVGYDGEVLQSVAVPERDVIVSADRDYAMGWATFSPDSMALLVANEGELRLLDGETGDPAVGTDGRIDLGNLEVTHPDWSPLGDFVAVAICKDAGNNKDVDECSIGRIPVSGNNFGTPEVLVAAAGGSDNNFFPRYSPDGAWIAYTHAAGKSKNQKKASLRIVAADGGAPIELVAASQRVGLESSILETGSTMPTWAPADGAGVSWLAFSSTRDYGVVLTGDKSDQLWVAGLDLAQAAIGNDPSFAAFWLPSQDIGERNHRAFWALDSAVDCASAVEVCDGYDNDCDGIVDNDCQPCVAEEICFDGADNDCNGAVDDLCIK